MDRLRPRQRSVFTGFTKAEVKMRSFYLGIDQFLVLFANALDFPKMLLDILCLIFVLFVLEKET